MAEGKKTNQEILISLKRAKRKNRYLDKIDDLQRILRLPVDQPLSEEEVKAWSDLCVREEYSGVFQLKPVQAWATIAAIENQGLFGTIGVGGGKTLITLKIAADLINQEKAQRPLLLVPAEVYEQLVNIDIPFYRKRVELFDMPVYILNRPQKERLNLCSHKRSGLYVVSYSMLSSKSGLELLATLEPDAIIGDEAHKLRNKNSARTKRIMAYIDYARPKCYFLSGTLTNKSIKDYHHLITAALGKGSPLPITFSKAIDWANVVDANADPAPEEARRLRELLQWVSVQSQAGVPFEPLEGTDQRAIRTAFQYRLRSAPGVVFSGEKIDISLFMVNHDLSPDDNYLGWKKLNEHIETIEELWQTPNGDEIDHAIHKHKWLWELSAGFYNELYWPNPGERVETARSNTRKYSRYETVSVDDDILISSQEYHQRSNEFARELRKWLQNQGRPGLDTPSLVLFSMINHGADEVGHELYQLWQYHREADFKHRIDRQPRAIRVCDYKVQYAKRWADQSSSGIIWYYHREIGKWLHEVIPEAEYCPAGREYDEKILKSEGKLVIASLTGHGTGKNLQFHQDQLFVEFPRTATEAEQSLGRIHRQGQKADEVIAHTTRSTLFDDSQFAACLNDALYIHQTLGEPQRLILAGYSPTPKIFPPNVLRERGFWDIMALSDQDSALLAERFGGIN